MKNFTALFIIIAVFISFPLVINNAHAGKKMKLYDDFDGSGFDSTKWDITDRGGVQITHDAADGRAVFFFPSNGDRQTSSWLEFIDCPENIVAIKATFITEGGCPNTGVRGRIGLHAGTFDGDYSWQQIDIQPGNNEIWGDVSVRYDPEEDLWYSLFWGRFNAGLDLSNGSYTLEIHFDEKKVVLKSDDLGEMIFAYPTSLGDITEIFKGIGLRANDNGSGDCTFYVDDVYVLRKGPCDKKAPKVKKYTKKGGQNLEYVDVVFNEAMSSEGETTTDGPSDLFGPSNNTMWLDGNKIIRLYVDPFNHPLPSGAIYEITLDGAWHDLKGYLMKEKTLKLKIK